MTICKSTLLIFKLSLVLRVIGPPKNQQGPPGGVFVGPMTRRTNDNFKINRAPLFISWRTYDTED